MAMKRDVMDHSDGLPGSVPCFGSRVAGKKYRPRPGVYGVVCDDLGRVALIEVRGVFFLPGGGVDAGESPEQALVRECREEAGREARILGEVGRALQYTVSRNGEHFALQCAYYQARFAPGLECPPTEMDHALHWLSAQDALPRFHREADAWAVKKALNLA